MVNEQPNKPLHYLVFWEDIDCEMTMRAVFATSPTNAALKVSEVMAHDGPQTFMVTLYDRTTQVEVKPPANPSWSAIVVPKTHVPRIN